MVAADGLVLQCVEAVGCPRRLWPVAFGLVNVVATGGTFCAIVIGTG